MPQGFLSESEKSVDPRGTQISPLESLSVLLVEQVSRGDNLKLGQAIAQLTNLGATVLSSGT